MTDLYPKPKGWAIATDVFDTGANVAAGSILTWPNYLAHDPGKEIVLLKKLVIGVDLLNMPLPYQEGVNQFTMGFRSGYKAAGTTWDREGYIASWIHKRASVWYEPATETAAASGGCEAVFDFSDDPIIINPVWLAVAVSTGGALSFRDGGFVSIQAWYQWAKSSEESATAYLKWEALG